MFCIKCGNQLPEHAKFCNKCGTLVTPVATDPLAQVPAQPSQPVAQYQSYSSHPYHRLGGWLGFIVYGQITAIALMAIAFVVSLIPVLRYVEYLRYLGPLPIFILIIGFAGYVMTSVFCGKFALMIIKKDARFLRFYELTMIVLCSMSIITIALTGFQAGSESLSSLMSSIFGFFVWTAYFRKSVRLRTYMGSDAYLRQSIFFKNA